MSDQADSGTGGVLESQDWERQVTVRSGKAAAREARYEAGTSMGRRMRSLWSRRVGFGAIFFLFLFSFLLASLGGGSPFSTSMHKYHTRLYPAGKKYLGTAGKQCRETDGGRRG